MRRSLFTFVVALLAACGGPSGAIGPQGAPGGSAAVAIEPVGANCALGGAKLTSASGVAYVCNQPAGDAGAVGEPGAPGATGPSGLSVSMEPEPPGAICPSGGVKFSSALGAAYSCSGISGARGSVGATGQTGAIGAGGATGATGADGTVPTAVAEDAGVHCPAGGVRVVSPNGDSFICTGTAGALGARGAAGPQGSGGVTGAMGLSVSSALEDAGVNCPPGGVRFISASGVVFSCNGAPGAAGPLGPSGTAGLAGTRGRDGTSAVSAPEDAGVNCPAGGVKVTSASGVAYICNGFDGTPGARGSTGDAGAAGVPVASALELAGTNCPAGGVKFTAASGVSYVCAGDAGPRGAPGPVGATGLAGGAGLNGINGTSISSVAGAQCANGGARYSDALNDAGDVCSGAPGARGPQGAPGSMGPNREQIGTLRNYAASVTQQTIHPAAASQLCSMVFDGTNLWISYLTGTKLMKVRPGDGATLALYPQSVTGTPMGLTFDGHNLWVANYRSGVTAVRATDGTQIRTVTVRAIGLMDGIAFDGNSVWVADNGGNTVSKVSVVDGGLISSVTTGDAPVGVMFDGTSIWVTNNYAGSVSKIRPSDSTLLGTYPAGVSPLGIAFDGQNIWVGNGTTNQGTITKLSPVDGGILATYNVGQNPNGPVFDGTNIWTSSPILNTVTKLRASDGALLGTYPAIGNLNGGGPECMAFDGQSVWVAFADGSLSKY